MEHYKVKMNIYDFWLGSNSPNIRTNCLTGIRILLLFLFGAIEKVLQQIWNHQDEAKIELCCVLLK